MLVDGWKVQNVRKGRGGGSSFSHVVGESKHRAALTWDMKQTDTDKWIAVEVCMRNGRYVLKAMEASWEERVKNEAFQDESRSRIGQILRLKTKREGEKSFWCSLRPWAAMSHLDPYYLVKDEVQDSVRIHTFTHKSGSVSGQIFRKYGPVALLWTNDPLLFQSFKSSRLRSDQLLQCVLSLHDLLKQFAFWIFCTARVYKKRDSCLHPIFIIIV